MRASAPSRALALIALFRLCAPQAAPAALGTISTWLGGAPDDATTATSALFVSPSRALALDGAGGLLVAMGSCVKRLNVATRAVTLVAGDCYSPTGTTGAYPVGDGAAASNPPSYRLVTPAALAANAAGVYIADSSTNNARVRFVSGGGVVTTAVGSGAVCGTADPTAGGAFAAATSVCVGSLAALAWAPDGALLIADAGVFAIKKFFPSNGSLTTIAGGGGAAPTPGATGNGAAWLGAPMRPVALAVSPAGVIHFVDGALSTVRALAANGSVLHVAGVNFARSQSPDGAPASASALGSPTALAFDALGRLMVLEGVLNFGARLRAVQPGGAFTTLMGSSSTIFSASLVTLGPRPATQTALSVPTALAADLATNTTYVLASADMRVRALLHGNGTASTVFGPTSPPPAVAGTAGAALQLYQPSALSWEPAGGALLVADSWTVRAFAGGSGVALGALSGGAQQVNYHAASVPGPLARAVFSGPKGIAADGAGGYFFITQTGIWNGTYVYRVSASGATTIFAGAGPGGNGAIAFSCYGGDGAAALACGFNFPTALAYDAVSGTLYVAETGACVVRSITAGRVFVYAGVCDACAGGAGDGGLATAPGASIRSPQGLAVDGMGNLFIAETGANRVRRVSFATKVISTVAGTGATGFSGDGASATLALLSSPVGVAVDDCGSVFVADTNNHRVRRVADGVITTVAGSGALDAWPGGAGDGGSAAAAAISAPTAVAVDGAGNLYVSEPGFGRVRLVSFSTYAACVASQSPSPSRSPTPSATPLAPGSAAISTLIGGAAVSATTAATALLAGANGLVLALDGAGGVLVGSGGCVRRLALASAAVSSVAGDCFSQFSTLQTYPFSDGGAPAASPRAYRLLKVSALLANATGTFIADFSNRRVLFASNTTGLISTVMGSAAGASCPADLSAGGAVAPASACLAAPAALTFAPLMFAGAVLVADQNLGVIRAFWPHNSSVATVAGNKTLPAPALASPNFRPWLASPMAPVALAIDANNASGAVAFIDARMATVRLLDVASGLVLPLAGVDFVSAFSSDGLAPGVSSLVNPVAIAYDGASRLMVLESVQNGNSRLRYVARNGSLITIAGGVTFSTAAYFYGSRAPPLALTLSFSSSLVFDASTNITFVGDAYNNRVRAFYPNATSSVVMGPTSHPPAVNGLPGAQLQLDSPFSVAVEPRSGAILVADRFALRWFSAAGVLNATVSGGQGNYNWVSTWGFPGRISRVFFPPYSRGMAPDFEGGYFYVHSAGNTTSNIHRVDGSTGATTVYAGSSALSCGGSLAPAPRLSTGFNAIAGLARDPASRTLYVAEAGACVIRAISPAGVASIFAGTCGNCTPGGLGDGGLARAATFGALLSVAVDAAGNVYVAEFPSRVRVVNVTTGIIRTYAGVGVDGFSGDGGPAELARLSLGRNLPSGMAFDACDNLFIADTFNNRVRRVTPAGVISTAAGSGAGPTWPGTGGDGGPATSATLTQPSSVAVTGSGELLVTDPTYGLVRAVQAGASAACAAIPSPTPSPSSTPSPTPSPSATFLAPSSGALTTFAGGASDFSVTATTASVPNSMRALALDGAGGLLVSMASCVRRLALATRAVTLVAGDCYSPTGTTGAYPIGNGAAAASPQSYRLVTPAAIAASAAGVYIADSSGASARVRFVSGGVVTTAVGSGAVCGTADPTAGGAFAAATSVCVGSLAALAWAPDGALLIADAGVFAIKKYFPANGSLTTIAGGGGAAPTPGATGNGAAWLGAPMQPVALAVSPAGVIHFVDGALSTVRALAANGSVLHVAGVNFVNAPAPSAAGGPAATTALRAPSAIAFDASGRLLIAERHTSYNSPVRVVSAGGGLGVLVGGGAFSIEGLATLAAIPTAAVSLHSTAGLAADAATNTTYVLDAACLRVRAVFPNGTTGTVFGPTAFPAAVVGLPGTALQLNLPGALGYEPVSRALLVSSAFDVRAFSVTTGAALGAFSGGLGQVPLPLATPAWGRPLLATILNPPGAVAPDFAGGVFIAQQSAAWNFTYILRVSANSTVSVFAGSGVGGSGTVPYHCFGGVANVPQLAAGFSVPRAAVADPRSGAVYVAEAGACVIRRLLAGRADVFAGTCGVCASSGDGGLATAATLNAPSALAVDAAGNVFFVGTIHRVRFVNVTTGIVRGFAGVGAAGFGGDGGPAMAALLSLPTALAFDQCGNLFIADTNNHRVRRVDPAGIITTAAGSGLLAPWPGSLGDGGPATAAALAFPMGVAVDAWGRLYISDSRFGRVRVVAAGAGAACAPPSPSPTPSATPSSSPAPLPPSWAANPFAACAVRTLAGSGAVGGVDGVGAAASFKFSTVGDAGVVAGVAVDANGTIYVADGGNHLIRSVSPAGATAAPWGSLGVGALAQGVGSNALFQGPTGLAIDATGTYMSVGDTLNVRMRKYAVASGNIVYTHSGVTPGGYVDGLFNGARWRAPAGSAFGPGGAVWAADAANHAIRMLSWSLGTTTTVAGGNGVGFAEGTAASFSSPVAVSVDEVGRVFICDAGNNAIRVLAPLALGGAVSTIAGRAGACGFSDGPVATAAFCSPVGIVVDGNGRLWIADRGNARIRTIDAALATVATVCGSGAPASFDGSCPFASFAAPSGIALSGNALVVTDANRVRVVTCPAAALAAATSPTPTPSPSPSPPSAPVAAPVCAQRITSVFTTTVAGSTSRTVFADGDALAAATLKQPWGVTVIGGTIYWVDQGHARVRALDLGSSTVSTVAGNGVTGPSVNGPALASMLNNPTGVVADPRRPGLLYLTQYNANQVFILNLTAGTIALLAGSGAAAEASGGLLTSAFDGPTSVMVDSQGVIVV